MFTIKRCLVSLLLVITFAGVSHAQFLQQGNKLTGTGVAESLNFQGQSVAVSTDGTTAIVGGRGAWIYIKSGGAWMQQAVLIQGAVSAVSVSADGNTAVLGRSAENAVLVFTRSGTNWTPQATITPSNAIGSASFGASVSIADDGNTVLAGGPQDNVNQGAAWVFTRAGGIWTQKTKLIGTGNIGSATQGGSVYLGKNGAAAIVGGSLDNNGAGAAWFYNLINGVWVQQAKLFGTGASGEAGQGFSVSMDERNALAIVGGPFDNGGAGAVWVFSQTVAGTFVQLNSKLAGPAGSLVGYSVAFWGGGILAGAVGDGANVGAVYRFSTSGGTPLKLSTTGNIGESQIGTSISTSTSGVLIAGGPSDNTSKGAAWVFDNTNGTWTQQGDKLVGTGVPGVPYQGTSVSLSGDGNMAIVGGYNDNINGTNAGQPGPEGAAWLFTRTAGNWAQQGSKLVATGNIGNASQGFSVAMSGDGNTAISGGYTDDNNKGAAWVFTRNGATWLQQSKLVATNPAGSSQQGFSVAIAADGNTALVGAPYDGSSTGATWVYTRFGTTWSQQAKLVGTGSPFSLQGYSVSLSDDGNTALVGGLGESAGIGAAWVFKRTAGAWVEVTKLVGADYTGFPQQGYSVSLSGDGNTAAVGGSTDNSGLGATWIFTQSSGTWAQQGSKLVGTGNSGNAFFGQSVSLSADGNKAVIGGFRDNNEKGAVWVFTRTGAVWTQQGNKLVGTTGSANANQGISVSMSGDGNTFIEGGSGDNNGYGAAWVFYADADDDNDGILNAQDCAPSDITKWRTGNFYIDADTDSYGTGGTVPVCYGATTPSGYSTVGGDCNDANAAINPAATEICDNQTDDNCNGQVDENCTVCANATALSSSNITSNSATLNWVAAVDPELWQLRYKTTNQGSQWTQLPAIPGSARWYVLASLKKNQNYNWQIRARCSNVWTAYSVSSAFKTLSANNIAARGAATELGETLILTEGLGIYPNPGKERFVLTLQLKAAINTMATIQLADLHGKIVQTENARMYNGRLQQHLNTAPTLANGTYIIRVIVDNKSYYTKLLHQK
jgi:hypothetical protein